MSPRNHAGLWITACPVSVPVETLKTQGTTTQVGPDRSGNSTWPGPRPTEGTTGLMHSVEPTSDNPPPPVKCPVCNAGHANEGRTIHQGYITANYLCPRGHVWLIRWLADGVA